MEKSIIDIILDSIFDDEWKGRLGEKMTERELKLVRLFGRKGKILRNVYIPKDNGETSEIDVMYITQKGIFVFESKNYSGWIFGDEKGQYWTAMLPNKQKNRFYNPIKQNQTHIKWLQKYIGEEVPLFSIIVFSDRCELKKVDVGSSHVLVIKRDLTYAAVKAIWEQHEDAVKDVDMLYEKLKPLTNVDDSVKKAHVEDIEKKYKQERGPIDITSADAPEVCPWCGKPLVLRTVLLKRGPILEISFMAVRVFRSVGISGANKRIQYLFPAKKTKGAS